MKKKTLSHLNFFNTLKTKSFCKFSFVMNFLHFKFPQSEHSSSRAAPHKNKAVSVFNAPPSYFHTTLADALKKGKKK